MLEGEIIQIGSYAEGTFVVKSALNGEKIICHFNNKEKYWDRLYSYLGSKPICLRGSIMVMGHFMVLEIIE